MKKITDFRIAGLPPSVNAMYVRKSTGVYKKQTAKDFTHDVVFSFTTRPRTEGPIALLLEYHVRTLAKFNRRDLDNMDKCLIDALQVAGQFRNDNQIVFRAGMKVLDTKNFVKGIIYSVEESIGMEGYMWSLWNELSTDI